MLATPLNCVKFEKESNKSINYSVEIKEFNDYLNISIISENQIPCTSFEKKIYLSDVKSNRYLSICANISELFISLEPQLKNINEIKLNEEETKLDLIIPLPNPLVKEVVFSIPQIKKDMNLEIKDLYKIINQQQIIINKLNERVTILEEKEKEREKKKKKK